MKNRDLPKPTEAELAILQVLWERGPSTVRLVQDQLASSRGTGYTTSLKLMQIMFEKGLLLRDDSNRSHIYSAATSRQTTQRQIIGQLLDQVFEGSAQQLILQALSAKKSSRAERDEIRKLIDKLDGGAQ